TAPPLPEPGRFYTPGMAAWAAEGGWDSDAYERALAEVSTRSIPPPPSLSCLAREYAARFGADGQDPPPSVVQALAAHCGAASRPKEALAVTGAPKDIRALFEAKLRHPKGALGLGVAPHPDGRITAALLRGDEQLSLAPLPRAPGRWTIKGRLLKGEGQVEVWLADAGGPRRLEVQATPTGAFIAEAEVAEGARVEITRKRRRFNQTLGLLIAGASPATYTPAPAPDARPDAAEAARTLIEAINAARVGWGLAPLRPALHLNARLDHYMERLASGQADAAPEGILDEQGWPYADEHYGFSEGRDGARAARLLLETPTGAALARREGAQVIAVGVRPFTRAAGFDAQVAILSPFERLDPDEARAILYGRLNAARAAAQLEPLQPVGEMEALAQKIAEATLEGRVAYPQAVQVTIDAIKADPPLVGAFGVGGFTEVHPAKATFTAQAMRPEMRYVGVGVLGGPTPGGGPPRYMILFITSTGRRGAEGAP
ncbi:hypothetical protein KKF91_04355, partial [Myxococcota bacterium]|nr:hypothetical protein [Myxococcota bacterium]MBU1429778.1 hypothetical protein [Myxococcota bacterium]MBU1896405.1 hypothetical protein [Myxococcota bacterium]